MSIRRYKFPGPPLLIQFSIWERGAVNLPQLTDQLLLAIKHAICDIITEYRLLTTPVCEPPTHYLRGHDTPMHSAPPSPTHTFLQSGGTCINYIFYRTYSHISRT